MWPGTLQSLDLFETQESADRQHPCDRQIGTM